MIGGVKFDSQKVRMDLLCPFAMEELAKVLTFGAKKYDSWNWTKGIKTCRLIAALLRHVFAYAKGEDVDPETGLHHMAHAMCCAMFVVGMPHYATGQDDRPLAKPRFQPVDKDFGQVHKEFCMTGSEALSGAFVNIQHSKASEEECCGADPTPYTPVDTKAIGEDFIFCHNGRSYRTAEKLGKYWKCFDTYHHLISEQVVQEAVYGK